MERVKSIISAHRQLVISVVLAAGIFTLWRLFYPHLLLAREQSQLFLCNTEYLGERLGEPGGLARYIGEGIVQFFIYPRYGALLYALLFIAIVWLTWRLLKKKGEKLKLKGNLLALIPALLLVYCWTNPEIPMTPTIAVVLSLVVMNLIRPLSHRWSLTATAVAMPLGYWLAGPAIVLVALYHLRFLCKEKGQRRSVTLGWTAAFIVLLVACIFVSGRMVPYPTRQLFSGIDYRWESGKIGTTEEMAYDRLLRQQDWAGISEKAYKKMPQSPAVQNMVQFARFRLGEIEQRELPMVMQYGGNVLSSEASAFIMSEIYLHMGWSNMSQRTAFEAMEAIPNCNKSGRSLQRLVETNIITGNYDVALKYLSILEETLFYDSWVKKVKPLAEHPQRIKEHPLYYPLQKKFFASKDAFFY